MTVENLVLGVKNTFLCTVIVPCIFYRAQYSKPVRSRVSIIWVLCKNQVFLVPKCKVVFQRPPGSARAHTPGILLLLLIWAFLWHCFLREETLLHQGAHNPELPRSMNLCPRSTSLSGSLSYPSRRVGEDPGNEVACFTAFSPTSLFLKWFWCEFWILFFKSYKPVSKI